MKHDWKPGTMIYPLPAVMVSCGNEPSEYNIITVAWVGTICTNPAMCYISVRPERFSYPILKKNMEFVINLTTGKLIRAADYCGVRSGKDEDKWKACGLTPDPASALKYAPVIRESPVSIECRVRSHMDLGSHRMYLAEVLAVQADDAYLDEGGRFCLEKAGLIAYSHGDYLSLGEKLGSFGFSVRKQPKGRKEAR